MDNDFIPAEEAAELANCTVAHLAQLRFRGIGAPFYRPSPRKILYKRSEVLAWLESTRATITGSRVRGSASEVRVTKEAASSNWRP